MGFEPKKQPEQQAPKKPIQQQAQSRAERDFLADMGEARSFDSLPLHIQDWLVKVGASKPPS